MTELLSEEDIVELTGTVQSKKQANILDSHGIYYIKKMDKTITTTWHHVNHPYSGESSASEPNLAAV